MKKIKEKIKTLYSAKIENDFFTFEQYHIGINLIISKNMLNVSFVSGKNTDRNGKILYSEKS